MIYIVLGKALSEAEFRTVIEKAKGDRLDQLVELLTLIEPAERDGIAAARTGQWIDVPDENAVKVYPGVRIGGSSEGAIWAAVEVGKDGKTLTLLKIVDTFSGDERQHAELLADALDRKNRGKRYRSTKP